MVDLTGLIVNDPMVEIRHSELVVLRKSLEQARSAITGATEMINQQKQYIELLKKELAENGHSHEF